VPVVVEHSKETYLAARIRRRRHLLAGGYRRRAAPSAQVAAAKRVDEGRPLRADGRRLRPGPLPWGHQASTRLPGAAVGGAASAWVAAIGCR